ncbi:hypothetical protein CLOM_g11896 [Closterium sp. NIES-68]|nr:hypothetical protein CLOM_g11896 [Closterium sp. NIES-68]GJP72273.1 hypothetical protein CLOP_g3022 [Closterium sp. NIES-67]
MGDEGCDEAGAEWAASLLSHESEPEWAQVAGMASDLVVTIGHRAFHVHQYPLFSLSTVIANAASSSDTGLMRVDLSFLPGGALAFIPIACYCYGRPCRLSPRSVLLVRSAASLLEMSACGPSHSVPLPQLAGERMQQFLQSWPHCLHVLASCSALPPSNDTRAARASAAEAAATLLVTGDKAAAGEAADKHGPLMHLALKDFCLVLMSAQKQGMGPAQLSSILEQYYWQWTDDWRQQGRQQQQSEARQKQQRDTAYGDLPLVTDKLDWQEAFRQALQHLCRLLPHPASTPLSTDLLFHLLSLACLCAMPRSSLLFLYQAAAERLTRDVSVEEHLLSLPVSYAQAIVTAFVAAQEARPPLQSQSDLTRGAALIDEFLTCWCHAMHQPTHSIASAASGGSSSPRSSGGSAPTGNRSASSTLTDSNPSSSSRSNSGSSSSSSSMGARVSVGDFKRLVRAFPAHARASHDALWGAVSAFAAGGEDEADVLSLCEVVQVERMARAVQDAAVACPHTPLAFTVRVLCTQNQALKTGSQGWMDEISSLKDELQQAFQEVEEERQKRRGAEQQVEVEKAAGRQGQEAMLSKMRELVEEVRVLRTQNSDLRQNLAILQASMTVKKKTLFLKK